ncbi:MAG: hypothetical protein O8C64_00540 [Candidatus Methanoperedens sp.]|nr:hypothetical protein [Candidatus Methanoperedens sp.]MCZ7404151.1 hypothetical protein [Candidatus Methanoperedens sp.]
MERCHICRRTKESLDKNETLISVEYDDGRKAWLCSICNGLIEKITESAIQSHLLRFDIDSHQELTDFVKSIVESYLDSKPEERS